MKKSIIPFGRIVTAASVLFLIYSCEKSVIDLSSGDSVKVAAVDVQTRSAVGGSTVYPLRVYAFDSDGLLVDRRVVETPDDGLSLYLRQGAPARIVALSALDDDYAVPERPTLDSLIRMRGTAGGPADGSANVALSALQMGFADVTPTRESVSAHIRMDYQVAALDIVLSGMPESCKSVNVSVSSVCGAVSFRGDGSGAVTSRVECVRYDDVWRSGVVYLLPGSGRQTVFTISYCDDDGESVSSVTYLGKLDPGVPYSLKGSYTDGTLEISGSVTASDWGDPVCLDFSFGPNLNPTIGSGGSVVDDDTDTFTVGELPAPCSIWQGHIVAFSEALTDSAALVWLLSLSDWQNVTSALNASTPNMAGEIASGYSEYGLDGWCIPDEATARSLHDLFNSSGALADVIEEAGGDSIVLENKGANVLYLCENAEKRYGYKSSSTVGDAGATVKYHLRLVRRVRMKVQ